MFETNKWVNQDIGGSMQLDIELSQFNKTIHQFRNLLLLQVIQHQT